MAVSRHHVLRTVSALALSLSVSGVPSAHAADGKVVASEMNGFGRLIFTLDKPIRAEARVSSGIIVLTFSEAVTVPVDKLATQAPGYVSVARRDPDGKSIRLATPRSFKVNVMEAGEKLFVDILPENWSGMLPSLPQDVIETLAARARAAEEALRKANQTREKREVRPLPFRVGQGPGFHRVIFEMGRQVPVEIERNGSVTKLELDAAFQVDVGALRAALPELLTGAEAKTELGLTRLELTSAPELDVRAFREDDTIIIDLASKAAKKPTAESLVPDLRGVETKTPAPAAASNGVAPAAASASGETANAPQPRLRSAFEPVQQTAPATRFESSANGLQVHLPISATTPAAAFMREDVLWMVFDTRDEVAEIKVPSELSQHLTRIDTERAAGALVVRATLPKADAVAFGPAPDAPGWVLSIGTGAATTSTPLTVNRSPLKDGKLGLVAKMPKPGQVIWLEDPHSLDRFAVIPTSGPALALAKQQSFVDLTLMPSVHGLAVLPKSDDLTIQAGIDDVTISREGGLVLSSASRQTQQRVGQQNAPLLLDIEAWRTASHGNVRDRTNEMQRAAAEASPKNKSAARIRLARQRLANGDYPEAYGILKVVEKDAPDSTVDKPILLLRAIAALFAHNHKEAAVLLGETAISLEGESFLWQSVMHGLNQRWAAALPGFRQTTDIVERYPEKLQLMMRDMTIRAAIEMNDAAFATEQLERFEQMQGQAGHLEKVALYRGRIALLGQQTPEATSQFDIAARSVDRETEAQARLERVLAMIQDERIDREKAKVELETIVMMWRRSETEIKALAHLGEIYAEESKWRQAFSAARRVTEIMADHPVARSMHDAMARRFEALFLEGKADSIPKIEALGLFYDFRHLMPISRRGDEIVRRLSERLVELDLLDQAAELLGHQVEHRLGGAQRARAAQRLAVIHLLNRKPSEAIRVLRVSRSNEIPEDVRRGRLILEARALSELSRTDLALEVLSSHTGDDIDRIRADILWSGKRWRESGEAVEKLLGDRWRGRVELSDQDRLQVMRAGVSYVLAEDRIGIDRLRQKYLGKMSASQDGKTFDMVTTPSRVRTTEFTDLARGLVAASSLSTFLDIYRQRYPEAAGAPKPGAADAARKEVQDSRAPAQRRG